MAATSKITRHDAPGGARVYRLPLRVFPGLEANAYLIVDGAYHALVDTGSGLDQSDPDLAAGFEAVRAEHSEAVSLARLDRIILTHGHIDHYGGLDFVRRRSDAPVAIHAYDRRVIEHHRERHVTVAHGLRRFFRYAGMAPAELEAAMALYHGSRAAFVGGPVATSLADGGLLDDRFKVVHVPGHCPGQVCLQWGDLLFTADHVLPATFPHLAPESITPWTGLAHYLDALTKVEALPGVRLALPGHGEAIADLPRRIEQVRESNARKLKRVTEACAEARATTGGTDGTGGTTIAEITALIYPRTRPYEALLALEKIGAYVEHLDQLGLLSIANLDAVAADEHAAPRWQVS
jgi:glyoxylase-like metal-dependent hydrolase (beta-lactamase superfamily II)